VGSPNYILLDHPELQETNDKVQSINGIYAKQVVNGVEIADLTMLNTENGATRQCMDMFLYHKVQENPLGKLTDVEKKEKRHQAGLAKKAGGARISTGRVWVTLHFFASFTQFLLLQQPLMGVLKLPISIYVLLSNPTWRIITRRR
jgi:hypothetical protein